MIQVPAQASVFVMHESVSFRNYAARSVMPGDGHTSLASHSRPRVRPAGWHLICCA